MFDVLNYAERNDVEVSIRKGHDGRTAWEIFLRDRNLDLTEFTRIIDIEIRGRVDQDGYIELRCEEMMDKIRSARMKIEYKEIENGDKENKTAQQLQAAELFFSIISRCIVNTSENTDLHDLYGDLPQSRSRHLHPGQ